MKPNNVFNVVKLYMDNKFKYNLRPNTYLSFAIDYMVLGEIFFKITQ